MARSINEIQQQIIDTYVSEMDAIGVIVDPTTWSKTSIELIWSYVVAFCVWIHEKLFDQHKQEVTETISKMKPHSRRWYAEMVKAFQFGYELVPEKDYYDNSGLTDEQIEAARVVKYAAVVRERKPNGRIFLRMKVATVVNGDLAPLSAEQLEAFIEYIWRIQDAGVDIVIESLPADRLKLRLKVLYNPLILAANGSRLDGSDSDPVTKAVRNYLQNLPFNGTFALAYLVDALQQVEGVVIPEIVEAYASYGLFPLSAIITKHEPDSGYLRIADEDLIIERIPQSVIK